MGFDTSCCLGTQPSWVTKPESQSLNRRQMGTTEGQRGQQIRSYMCFPCVGKLDVEAVALAGHSYGGATVTALCSQEPAFKCTVALDPWW